MLIDDDDEEESEAARNIFESSKKSRSSTHRFHCWKCDLGLATRIGISDHIHFVHYGMKNYR